jgi:hypothetical protein
VITGNVTISRGSGSQQGWCWLQVATKQLPALRAFFNVGVGAGYYTSLSLTGGVQVGARGATAKLRCASDGVDAWTQVTSTTMLVHKTNSLGVITQ